MRSRFWQGLLFSIFSCSFLLSTAQAVSACQCGPRPTVLESFDESDDVVIVRVVSVEKAEDTDEQHYVDGVRSATLIVERVFKGKLKIRDEIVFGQGGGADCIWTFDDESVGRQLLFYLNRPEKFTDRRYLPSKDPGLWYAFGCGRSTGLGGATDDLLYLENMTKRRGKTRISGTIGGWQNPDLDVVGKKIKIIGSKKTYETKTDEDGVFEIYDLPPGKYFIEPEMPAGWKIDPSWLRYSPSVIGNGYGQPELKSPKQVAVNLEPKKHAGVDLAFTVDNSVRGRVLSPKGKPMERVCVYLLRPEQEKWGPSDCTDEQGRFEITSVPLGEYVLVANQDGKPSDREPFGKIFYPNVSDRDRAAVISIGAGDKIDNLDVVIPKLEETITIEGVLRYSDGKPAVEEWVKFKVTKADDKVEGDVSEKTDSAGRFTLRVLKGLTGEISGEDWLMTGLYKNCPKVDDLLEKSGRNNVTVQSSIIKLTTEQNVYEVELTLPFPLCEKAKD
jgi:hypothetical protein